MDPLRYLIDEGFVAIYYYIGPDNKPVGRPVAASGQQNEFFSHDWKANSLNIGNEKYLMDEMFYIEYGILVDNIDAMWQAMSRFRVNYIINNNQVKHLQE